MGESRITPSGIINDAVSMIGKMNDSSFPIDVFPNKIRNIILDPSNGGMTDVCEAFLYAAARIV